MRLTLAILIQPIDVDFVVEMSHVADDAVLLQIVQMLAADNVRKASGGDNDLGFGRRFFQCFNLESYKCINK